MNLTQDNIKKGVINGTNQKDVIAIDGNNVSSKKLTIKAGNGDDEINAKNFDGTLYVYAGLGNDKIKAGKGTNYLYGESGYNVFTLAGGPQNTIISAGKGIVHIDFTEIQQKFNIPLSIICYFKYVNDYFKRVNNDLKIIIREDTTVTLKDFYKQRGQFFIGYSDSIAYDLRKLSFITDLQGAKSPNSSGSTLDDYIKGDKRNNIIKGGDGNDIIIGGVGNDKLYGEAGNDYIEGGEGNDTLYAGEGAEKTLWAGDGNDVVYGSNTGIDEIDGGAGNNKLYGKKGENTYYYWAGGNDTIYLEDGSSTNLILEDFTISGKEKIGNDLKIYLDDGYGTNSHIVLKNFFNIKGIGETISVYTGNSDESIPYVFDEYFNPDLNLFDYRISGKGTIKGTQYNDDIEGSQKADKIYAINGYDSIAGLFGNDTIYAGESSSTVFFSNNHGKDKLYGDFAKLHFDSLNSFDQLTFKKVGDDLVINHTANDSATLVGYFANKSFAEYIGVGKKITQEKELSVLLEDYENHFTYNKGDGSVKFYSLPNSKNNVNLQGFTIDDLKNMKITKSGNNLVFSGLGGKNGKITVVDYFKDGINVNLQLNGEAIESLNEIMRDNIGGMSSTKFTGTIFNEVVTGTSGNDVIKTKDGHDTINASNGNDIVYAGTGNDVINYEGSIGNTKLYGESGNDTIIGGDKNDYINGGAGNDSINGYSGDDKLYGDKGNDYIYGEAGKDTIDGGDGNDYIYGGNDDDSIKGGAGNDTIYGEAGQNTIYGGKGDDCIYIRTESSETSKNLIHGDTGNDTINAEKGSYNKLYGDTGNDCISVLSASTNNYINAGDGHDWIDIYSVNNEIYAGKGNDTISLYSNAKNSKVNAGAGNDIINMNAIDIEVEGGAGNDTYNINAGNGEIEDSAGNDTYYLNELDSVFVIDDSKGKDTLILSRDREHSYLLFDVSVNNKGKINNIKDIDLYILLDGGEDKGVIIEDYFGSGCIERIETSDGYYVTKDQMNSVAQEVAAWLVENGISSFGECPSDQKEDLLQIYQVINWQK